MSLFWGEGWQKRNFQHRHSVQGGWIFHISIFFPKWLGPFKEVLKKYWNSLDIVFLKVVLEKSWSNHEVVSKLSKVELAKLEFTKHLQVCHWVGLSLIWCFVFKMSGMIPSFTSYKYHCCTLPMRWEIRQQTCCIFNRRSLFNMYCCPWSVVCGVWCVITKSVTGLYKGYCWQGGHWGWWARQRQHICCTRKTTRIMESWAVPTSGLNKNKNDFRCPPFFSLHPSKNISNPEQNLFCPSSIFFYDVPPPN